MKNTPRDFFLHFGAFAALYLAAIALITLLFRLIDYAFPDALSGLYYADPYSGMMRFAIASLIILAPIFLFLLRVIQMETRKNPERQTLGIRKWLTYITLFIAGATIVGDLIALLNSFLGGTLATTFLLKVLALLLVMGAAFWYFLLDVRGYWQQHERESKTIGIAVGLILLVVVIGGFFIMGSPMSQRDIRVDQEQIMHLETIQSQLVTYWQQNGELPEDMGMLNSDLLGYLPTAPEGRPAYTYQKTGDLSFELCATFSTSSEEYSARLTYPAMGFREPVSWNYKAGEQCFTRTIDTNLVKPFPPVI